MADKKEYLKVNIRFCHEICLGVNNGFENNVKSINNAIVDFPIELGAVIRIPADVNVPLKIEKDVFVPMINIASWSVL